MQRIFRDGFPRTILFVCVALGLIGCAGAVSTAHSSGVPSTSLLSAKAARTAPRRLLAWTCIAGAVWIAGGLVADTRLVLGVIRAGY